MRNGMEKWKGVGMGGFGREQGRKGEEKKKREVSWSRVSLVECEFEYDHGITHIQLMSGVCFYPSIPSLLENKLACKGILVKWPWALESIQYSGTVPPELGNLVNLKCFDGVTLKKLSAVTVDIHGLHFQVTVGASFLSQTIALQDSTTVNFEIWDTYGQERYAILTPLLRHRKKKGSRGGDSTGKRTEQRWLTGAGGEQKREKNKSRRIDRGKEDSNLKFLLALLKKWDLKVTSIRDNYDLEDTSLDEIYGMLKTHELEMNDTESSNTDDDSNSDVSTDSESDHGDDEKILQMDALMVKKLQEDGLQGLQERKEIF
ncbi:hypothetical protein AgCh_034637 [Apium graveolens]